MTDTTDDKSQQLCQQLEQSACADLNCARELLETLETERELLQQHNPKALPQVIERKEQLLKQLDQAASQRSHCLRQLQLPQTADAWLSLLQQQPSETLAGLWLEFQQLVEKCREINEINGRMIGRSQQSIARLLSILRGTLDAPKLYDNRGSTRQSGHSHCVTEA